MGFKQHLRYEYSVHLDETYSIEAWEKDHPGKAYFDLHINTIEAHERAAPTFREFLGKGGMKILESGCGTGRWMAYFEKLGNRSFGIDDSRGPLKMGRKHDPNMILARANVLESPFLAESFDAAFSSYVAEHFEEGPETLFREIHRVLKPNGLLFVVVPFNNKFRSYVVNPLLMLLQKYWIGWKGQRVGFTEFRYSKADMDGFLARTGFEVVDVRPDDYFPPWSKGLYCDLCDLGCFFAYEPKPPYEFGPFGRAVAAFIRLFGIWGSCGGIFYIARARK